ncbi:class Ib ribonucleoside-diphosphate reductase assembly flavoprotein NrdI [Mycoplasma sp. HU2014]|uniref:class Ib ribonucleoside-diphosphate reductase assembly flavoprotein NrdI n=1 Tax=Mycoplasma sp. HU2014 TaxID=1664275 RepID=UPI00067C8F27|nr:class Ib ribonucleoside-diphosphate reductase assembly flavoprotein NrdI [Mycoplasma sp. HU2014]KNG79807.1 ribonucleoside-diphosphate reductase stimulatory protein [Mycoplasma sp. HU2014]
MHENVKKVSADDVVKPKGAPFVVYFSSISNNTHRFIQKLGIDNARIPYEIEQSISVNKDYVLCTPTYSGGGEHLEGAVPKQVIKFLNNPENRKYCRGVIASGNSNFGDTFGIAGPIISKKLNVPFLYQFELLGTQHDVSEITKILNKFWEDGNNER